MFKERKRTDSSVQITGQIKVSKGTVVNLTSNRLKF